MEQETPAGGAGDDPQAGAEENSPDVRRAENVEAGRAALEAQARHTAATTPPGLRSDAGREDTPAAPAPGNDDASRAAEHVRQAAANREALEEHARRANATTPPDLRAEGGRSGG